MRKDPRAAQSATPQLLSLRAFLMAATALLALTIAVYLPSPEFSIHPRRSPFWRRSANSVFRPRLGIFFELRLGAIHRRATKLLSPSFSGLAEAKFPAQRNVSLGLAFTEPLKTHRRRRSAGTAGLDIVAGPRCGFAGSGIVRLASVAYRVGGVGDRA